ncbi:MAG: hypothetical protein K2P76_06310 [Lachnospiraceae bacterium]|nr:hypothetical protein [Lachnospiraceae bacterium]MDE6980131.1 hypothetical protein [Lachnospiraceae bacterium]
MNYTTFKLQITRMLQEHFKSDAKIFIQPLTKNNNITIDGLIIQENSINISPTLHLFSYYEDYQRGGSIEKIFKNILEDYKKRRPGQNLELSFFTQYDLAKYHIIFKVVHYESNRELLKRAPHFRFLDLAVVFSCLLADTPAGNATILILNNHMEYWNVTKEQLFSAAKTNTPALLPFQIHPIEELLEKMMPEAIPPEIKDKVSLYAMSNPSNLHGASALLYPEYIQDFAAAQGCDLYILPSSIHEILLMPAEDDINPQDLTVMICEVNEKHVQKDEILSYHPYYYSRKKQEITMLCV